MDSILKDMVSSKELVDACLEAVDTGYFPCYRCGNQRAVGEYRYGRTRHSVKQKVDFYLPRGLCLSCRKNVSISNVKASKALKISQKAQAVEYMGGECVSCGLKTKFHSVYEFHHVDPSIKLDRVSALLSKNDWDLVLVELKKCLMLCATCHRVVHERLRRPDLVLENES